MKASLLRTVSDQDQHEAILRDGYPPKTLQKLLRVCIAGIDDAQSIRELPDSIITGICEAAQVALFRATLGKAGE